MKHKSPISTLNIVADLPRPHPLPSRALPAQAKPSRTASISQERPGLGGHRSGSRSSSHVQVLSPVVVGVGVARAGWIVWVAEEVACPWPGALGVFDFRHA